MIELSYTIQKGSKRKIGKRSIHADSIQDAKSHLIAYLIASNQIIHAGQVIEIRRATT